MSGLLKLSFKRKVLGVCRQRWFPQNDKIYKNKKNLAKSGKKGKIKSHSRYCIPDSLNSVRKFLKIFAENPCNNLRST